MKPLQIRLGSIFVVHKSSGSTLSNPFIGADPSDRGELGWVGPIDSSTSHTTYVAFVFHFLYFIHPKKKTSHLFSLRDPSFLFHILPLLSTLYNHCCQRTNLDPKTPWSMKSQAKHAGSKPQLHQISSRTVTKKVGWEGRGQRI